MFTVKTNYTHLNQTKYFYLTDKLHTFTPNQIFLSYRQTTHIHTKPNMFILQTNNSHSHQTKYNYLTDQQLTFTSNQMCSPCRQTAKNSHQMCSAYRQTTHIQTKPNVFSILINNTHSHQTKYEKLSDRRHTSNQMKYVHYSCKLNNQTKPSSLYRKNTKTKTNSLLFKQNMYTHIYLKHNKNKDSNTEHNIN